MSSQPYIIFDCDGVLVDSEIIAARVEAKLLSDAGYPIEAEAFAERFAGLTFLQILTLVEEEAGIALQASMIEQAEKLIDKRLRRELKPIDGAREALLGATHGYCICSNSSDERLAMALEKTNLAPFITGPVWSAKSLDGVHEKPAPDIFLHAARKATVSPENCYVIEDSIHGIAGAKAAGMRVIGFTGASHSWPGHGDRLTEAGAEIVINRLRDVSEMVRALAEFGPVE